MSRASFIIVSSLQCLKGQIDPFYFLSKKTKKKSLIDPFLLVGANLYSCRDSFPFQESLRALLNMRRNVKEKELEALLAGEQDSCSCYIEVIARDQHKLLLLH